MDKVNISYLELTKNKKDINTKEVEKWKYTILTNITIEMNKLIGYVLENKEIINENNNKKEIKIESKSQIIFLHLKIYKKKIRKLQ